MGPLVASGSPRIAPETDLNEAHAGQLALGAFSMVIYGTPKGALGLMRFTGEWDTEIYSADATWRSH